MVEKSLAVLADDIVKTIEEENKQITQRGFKEKIKAKDFLERLLYE